MEFLTIEMVKNSNEAAQMLTGGKSCCRELPSNFRQKLRGDQIFQNISGIITKI